MLLTSLPKMASAVHAYWILLTFQQVKVVRVAIGQRSVAIILSLAVNELIPNRIPLTAFKLLILKTQATLDCNVRPN